MCILPRYGSPHGEPVSFPGRDLLPSLLCSYLTPGRLSLPQRLPYVVLPLASPYVFTTWYLLYAGCGFRSVPLLGGRFPSVIHTHCTEQQCRSSLPKPCPIFRPNWCGGLAGFRRALEGVSNSGVFQRDPISQSH